MAGRKLLGAAALGAAAVVAALLWTATDAPDRGPREPGDPAPAAGTTGPAADAGVRPRTRARPEPATDAAGTPDRPPPGVTPRRARLVVRVTSAADGSPVAEARVEAVVDAAPDVSIESATTDAAGHARVELTLAGEASVLVRAARHVRAERTVAVVLGEERAIDVVLARGVAVIGRVVRTEDGAPVAGATVDALEGGARGGAAKLSFAGPLGTATSGADGSFRIDGIPPGDTVTLRAGAPRRATASVSIVAAEDDPPPDHDAATAGRVELRLEPAGTVSGSVRDRAGRPVAGARVYLVPADEPSLVEEPELTLMSSSRGRRAALRSRAGADGAWVIDCVPLGATHVALARADGHATSKPNLGVLVDAGHPSRSIDLVLRDVAGFEIAVLTTDGSPVAGAQVEIRRKARPVATVETDASGVARAEGLDVASFILTARKAGHPPVTRAHAAAEGESRRVEIRLPAGVTIEGTVADDAGRPLAGARVHAFRPSWEDAYDGLPDSEGAAVSDAQGLFRIEGLQAGPHELWAQEEGRPVTGKLGPVVAPATGVRLVSVRRAMLRFRVVVPKGAVAPDELHVHIASLVHRPRWIDGPIEIAGLEPGPATVKFRVAGYVGIDRGVDLTAGAAADLGDVVLDPGLDVRGRVVDASGNGVAAATLRFGDVFTPTLQDVTSDAKGAFRLQHLAPGANDVDVSADGFLSRTAEVVAGQGAGDARIVLTRGGLLAGVVRGPDAQPLADVFVHVVDAAAKESGAEMDDREAWKRTDARGAFETRLLAGRYRVDIEWKAIGEKVVKSSVEVDLADGETTPLAVSLTR